MMNKYFTLFYIFQIGIKKKFGELQLPRNLRLGHCAIRWPCANESHVKNVTQITLPYLFSFTQDKKGQAAL